MKLTVARVPIGRRRCSPAPPIFHGSFHAATTTRLRTRDTNPTCCVMQGWSIRRAGSTRAAGEAADAHGTSAKPLQRRAAEATGRAETAQSEIASVGQSLETLAGSADRNATLADHLRQVADDIGRSTSAMKTAIAQGQGRVA